MGRLNLAAFYAMIPTLLLALTACGIFGGPTGPDQVSAPATRPTRPAIPSPTPPPTSTPLASPTLTATPTTTATPPATLAAVATPTPTLAPTPAPTPVPATATPLPPPAPEPTPRATSIPLSGPAVTPTPAPVVEPLPGPVAADRDDIYITAFPLLGPDSSFPEEVYLSDGNINGGYHDPAEAPGYLEGPALAVFDWNEAREAEDCPVAGTPCAPIMTSRSYRETRGLTRPYWGQNQAELRGATAYYRLTDMARNYFDPNNSIDRSLEDVALEDKLVAVVDWEAEPPCRDSCLRLHRQSTELLRDARPDGRNEGVPYSQRPKLLLSTTDGWELQTQARELGRYYHVVFLPRYGPGGGFPQFGEHQEKALNSGLGNWYASDYTDTFLLAAWATQRRDNPLYLWYADPSQAYQRLGDVLTSALWRIRELPGTDQKRWRRTILALVDRQASNEFATKDAYGGGSIIRGFARQVFQEAEGTGVFADSQARSAACLEMVKHELLPPAYHC